MKNVSRFAEWQKRNVAERELLVREFLKQSRRSRASYPNITALADATAAYITQIERKDSPCSRTTILRNVQYKSLLTHFLANQRGVRFVSEDVISDDRAKSVITGLQLEHYNLKQENIRLQKYINTIDAELEFLKQSKGRSVAIEQKNFIDNDVQLNLLKNDYGLVCKSLWLILNHFSDIVSADPNLERVLDKSVSSRGGKNIVVDADNIRPYFAWLRDNSGAVK